MMAHAPIHRGSARRTGTARRSMCSISTDSPWEEQRSPARGQARMTFIPQPAHAPPLPGACAGRRSCRQAPSAPGARSWSRRTSPGGGQTGPMWLSNPGGAMPSAAPMRSAETRALPRIPSARGSTSSRSSPGPASSSGGRWAARRRESSTSYRTLESTEVVVTQEADHARPAVRPPDAGLVVRCAPHSPRVRREGAGGSPNRP
jgi:hypothetical protein